MMLNMIIMEENWQHAHLMVKTRNKWRFSSVICIGTIQIFDVTKDTTTNGETTIELASFKAYNNNPHHIFVKMQKT